MKGINDSVGWKDDADPWALLADRVLDLFSILPKISSPVYNLRTITIAHISKFLILAACLA